MNKKTIFFLISILIIGIITVNKQETTNKLIDSPGKKSKKTLEQRQMFSEQRALYEFNMQKNPITGKIPQEEKKKEYENAILAKQQSYSQSITSNIYTSRGPSNLGGRTRALVIDKSDDSGNTIISGGVSSGVFRTTNGGDNWTKVSSNSDIHNVTAIAQDPREGFQHIWYYGTGEKLANSASLLPNVHYNGEGVWKSTDSGLTWTHINTTDPIELTLINAMEVDPETGFLFIATNFSSVWAYNGTAIGRLLSLPSTEPQTLSTDIVVGADGRLVVGVEGNGLAIAYGTDLNNWELINNGPNWAETKRIALAAAPSNSDVVYVLYQNGDEWPAMEADLWKYQISTSTWTNYSDKLPDFPGSDLETNDPFSVQGGYDLVVSVKPDNENFVVIGGSNAYKIENIVNDDTFKRFGGYRDHLGYTAYPNHHADIHVLEFDPNNFNVLFSGTDGGVHKTLNINSDEVEWESLNNDYVTYQFYHAAIDQTPGSNLVIGGAQDNGTVKGGHNVSTTEMNRIFGGDGVAVGIGNLNNLKQFYFGYQNGRIYRQVEGGNSTSILPTNAPTGNDALFVTYFYLDPDNNGNLYYAGKNSLYKTSDASAVEPNSWTNAGELDTGEDLRSFATTRGPYWENSFLLIGGDSGGIFKLDDPLNAESLDDAINITPADASTVNNTIVAGLAISPVNNQLIGGSIAMAAYSNYGVSSIFLTVDAYEDSPNWVNIENNLSEHSIRSVALTDVDEDDNITYFAGTSSGLYSTTDPYNSDWILEGPDTIGLSVISTLDYRPSDKTLLVGTHGNGMFETTVGNTLSTNDYSKTTDVYLYPNPTQDKLNFRSETIDFTKTVTYEIYSLTGKRVLKGTLNNQKVDVRILNPGIYFVNLSVGKTNQTLKFIKN